MFPDDVLGPLFPSGRIKLGLCYAVWFIKLGKHKMQQIQHCLVPAGEKNKIELMMRKSAEQTFVAIYTESVVGMTSIFQGEMGK